MKNKIIAPLLAALFLFNAAALAQPISALPQATSVDPDDVVAVTQGSTGPNTGTTRKAHVSQVVQNTGSQAPPSSPLLGADSRGVMVTITPPTAPILGWNGSGFVPLGYTPINPANNGTDFASGATTLTNLGGLAKALPTAQLWLGDGSGLAAQVSISGDCVISSSGVLTCTKTAGTSLSGLATASAGSGLSLSGGVLTATGTSLTVPTASLLSGNGTTLGGIGLGTGETIDGSNAHQTNAIMNTQAPISAPYVVQASDNNKTLAVNCDNPSLPITVALEAPAFYPSNFRVRIMAACTYNGGLTGSGVRIVEAGTVNTSIAAYTLYPAEVVNIDSQSGTWIDDHQGRWKKAAFRPNGPTTAITALAWAGASFNGYQVGDQLHVPSAPTGSPIVPGMGVYRSGVLAERIIGYGRDTTGGAGYYLTTTVGSIGSFASQVAFTAGGVTATLGGSGSLYFESNDPLSTAGNTPSGYNSNSQTLWVPDDTHIIWPAATNPGTATVFGNATDTGSQIELMVNPPLGRDAALQITPSALAYDGTKVTATVGSTAAMVAGEPVAAIGATPSTYDVAGQPVTIVDGTHFTYTIPGSQTAPAIGSASVRPLLTFGPNDGLAWGVGRATQTMKYASLHIGMQLLDTAGDPTGGGNYIRVNLATNQFSNETAHVSYHGMPNAGGHGLMFLGRIGSLVVYDGNEGTFESHLGGSEFKLLGMTLFNFDGFPPADAEYGGHIEHDYGDRIAFGGGSLLISNGPSQMLQEQPLVIEGKYYRPALTNAFTDGAGVLHVNSIDASASPLVLPYSTPFDGGTLVGQCYVAMWGTNGTTGNNQTPAGTYQLYAITGGAYTTTPCPATNVGSTGEAIGMVPTLANGNTVFAGALANASATASTTLTASATLYGALAAGRLLGPSVPTDTFVVSCAGSSCTLNKAITVSGMVSIGAGGPANMLNVGNAGGYKTQVPNAAWDFIDDIAFSTSIVQGATSASIDLGSMPQDVGGSCVQIISALSWTGGIATATVPDATCGGTYSAGLTTAMGSINGSNQSWYNAQNVQLTVVDATHISYPEATNPVDGSTPNCSSAHPSCQLAVNPSMVTGRSFSGTGGTNINIGSMAFAGSGKPLFDATSGIASGDANMRFPNGINPLYNTVANLLANYPCNSQIFGYWTEVSDAANATVGTVVGVGNESGSHRVTVSCDSDSNWHFLANIALPAPGASTLGGVDSKAATTHQFINAINTDGSVSAAQPAATDVSGLAASATTDTTNATNITSGALPVAQMSALFSAGTWAGRPGSPTANQLYLATDIGSGCLLQYNGTIWHPASGMCVLYTRNAVSTPTSASAETNLDQFNVPAGLGQIGSVFDVCVTPVATGTANTKTVSVRVISGTTPTASGGLQLMQQTSVAANLSSEFCRKLYADGTSGQFAATAGVNGASWGSGTIGTDAINMASAWNFSLNGSTVNAGDSIAYRGVSIRWWN